MPQDYVGTRGATSAGFPNKRYTPAMPYSYPTTPAPTYGGGGGGGDGGGGGHDDDDGGGGTGWTNYTYEGAPSWWQGQVNWSSPDTQFGSLMNAAMPFMSPEDQQYMGSSLSRMFQDQFGYLNPLVNNQFQAPLDLTSGMLRNQYSSDRGTGIMNALSAMAKASGKSEKDLGPGYAWFQQFADIYKDLGVSGATEMPTATALQSAMGRMDPLLAEAKGQGALAPYAEIARALTQPFFSAGPLLPRTQGAQGQQIFGQANPMLW